MRKNPNKSYYHYILITDDEEDPDTPPKYEYFMTLEQLCNHLNCSRYLLYKLVTIENYKSKKLPNISLKKCYLPVKTEQDLSVDDLDYLREELFSH